MSSQDSFVMDSIRDQISFVSQCSELPSAIHSPNTAPTTQPHSNHNYFSSINLSNRNLTSLQTAALQSSLHRIILSHNSLRAFEFKEVMTKLRYLDITNNEIEDISHLVDSAPHLEEIKVMNNRLENLVALPQVKYYYATNNPIRTVSGGAIGGEIVHLAFDWMMYMSATPDIMPILDTLTAKLKQTFSIIRLEQDKSVTLIDFLEMLDSKKLFTRKMLQYTHLAIKKSHSEVFDYIQSNFQDLRGLDEEKCQTKTLFEHSVIHKCERAIDYFFDTGVKSSRVPKVDYMHIACKYNNLQLFNRLIDRGFNVNSEDSKGNSLLHEIVSNFNHLSPEIFLTIVKSHYNPDKPNKRKLNPLLYAANISVDNLIHFLKYIESNKHCMFLFNFHEIGGFNYSQNILHFAVRLLNFGMVKIIVDNEMVNPFIINSLKKRPRQIPSSGIIKKMLTKFQHQYFRRMMGVRDRIKKSLLAAEDGDVESGGNYGSKREQSWYSLCKSLFQSNKSERMAMILKTLEAIESLNSSLKSSLVYSQQICLNQTFNLSQKNTLSQCFQNDLERVSESAGNCLLEYNMFQGRLYMQRAGQSSKSSQSINSEIRFKVNDSQILMKKEDPMRNTTKLNRSISFCFGNYVQIKGGRRLKCLNIP